MTDVEKVKGVGPKTAKKLRDGGFDTAEKLAKATVDEIIGLGIGKATASKIIKNAAEVSTKVEEAPEAVEAETSAEAKAPAKKKAKEPKKPAKAEEEKPKKKTKKKAKKEEKEPEQVEEKAEEPVEKVEKPKKEKKPEKVEEPEKEVKPEKTEEPEKEEKPEKAEKPEKEEKPEKAKKPKKKTKKKRLPPEEEVITTKKKKGVQVTKVDEEEIAKVEILSEEEKAQRETWAVTAKKLSKEELEARKRRQKLRAEADKITREIPTRPKPVKAQKAEKKKKTERPVKKEKVKKEVKVAKQKEKKKDLFYSPREVFHQDHVVKPRGKSGVKGESKPRSIVGKGTVIGESVSFRRSRRVIHPQTLIVKLKTEFDPETLLGKKVEIQYPDTNKRVKGSITKRFGKRTSKKVLVRFEKGVRTAGLHQPVVIR